MTCVASHSCSNFKMAVATLYPEDRVPLWNTELSPGLLNLDGVLVPLKIIMTPIFRTSWAPVGILTAFHESIHRVHTTSNQKVEPQDNSCPDRCTPHPPHKGQNSQGSHPDRDVHPGCPLVRDRTARFTPRWSPDTPNMDFPEASAHLGRQRILS